MVFVLAVLFWMVCFSAVQFLIYVFGGSLIHVGLGWVLFSFTSAWTAMWFWLRVFSRERVEKFVMLRLFFKDTIVACVVMGFLVGYMCFSSRVLSHLASGDSYHVQSVRALCDGWNPIRSPDASSGVSFDNRIVCSSKGNWILEAFVTVNAGVEIETAKQMFSILFVVLCAVTAFGFMRQVLGSSRWLSCLVAGLYATNPVVIEQILSTMVDGQFASIFSAWIVALLWFAKSQSRTAGLLLGLLTVLLVNIKLTAVVYVIVVSAGYGIYIMSARAERFFSWLRVMVVSCVFGGVLAWNPFVVNAERYGHILGMYGAGRIGTAEKKYDYQQNGQIPVGLGQSRFEDFIRANISLPQSDVSPLVVMTPRGILSSLYGYSDPGVRSAGFGPLYLALLLMSLGLLLFVGLDRHIDRVYIGTFAAALCSVFICPQAWWARFVPQAYSLLFIPLWAVLLRPRMRNCGRIYLVLLSANLLLVLTGFAWGRYADLWVVISKRG